MLSIWTETYAQIMSYMSPLCLVPRYCLLPTIPLLTPQVTSAKQWKCYLNCVVHSKHFCRALTLFRHFCQLTTVHLHPDYGTSHQCRQCPVTLFSPVIESLLFPSYLSVWLFLIRSLILPLSHTSACLSATLSYSLSLCVCFPSSFPHTPPALHPLPPHHFPSHSKKKIHVYI